jgi:PAS domain S-box-containing protein
MVLKQDRKEALKHIIKSLHEGADPETVKEKFRDLLKDVTSVDIAKIEEELINEGMPREEIQRLCDVHLVLFREKLEKEKALAPEGHPIHILMEEHKILLGFAEKLINIDSEMERAKSFEAASKPLEHLHHVIEHLKESESHYLREENVLFPYLEKHGVTQPPAIMWMEHDRIREVKKGLYVQVDAMKDTGFQQFIKQLKETSVALSEMLSNHFYKENNVLFPTALKVIPKDEWTDIRRQFDEMGYCCFTPESATIQLEEATAVATTMKEEGKVNLETGVFSREELEAVLNTLPVDITFVDRDDTVQYFSQGKDRLFMRTKAIIGRKVQQCHPQKSVHMVNRILDSFHKGTRDVAEFWLTWNGKLIHIRYFAVRNSAGKYLGCVEVTQDITNIKKIEGEKRLLDWK